MLPPPIVGVIYVFSFGGGPAVNRLSACKPCIQEAERLHRRQQHEKQAFLEVSSSDLAHSKFMLKNPSCWLGMQKVILPVESLKHKNSV